MFRLVTTTSARGEKFTQSHCPFRKEEKQLHTTSLEFSYSPRTLTPHFTMIYDTNSAQFQQFLRSSGRRRDDYGKSKTAIVSKQTSKPAGAASTGL